MKLVANSLLMVATLVVLGCGSKDTTEPATETPEETAPETTPTEETAPETEPVPEAEAEAAPAESADYITVIASHNPAKPDDPVEVKFEKFDVVQADFDPKNLEGGSAELVVDLTSLKTGSDKRDGHLQSPDYLNVEKFAQAHISITKVKKTGDNTYDAEAVVSVHGKEATWPVSFEVIETGEGFVRVKAEHAFKRSEFGVGKKKGDPTADEMKVQLELTLRPNS